jgi:hypothetical protein
MKATTLSILALVLVLSAAHAQTSQSDSSGTTQETTPISGIDEAAFAGSARASKLIGSKGDKLVAIPVSQLKVGSEAKFATDLTKEQLARAPAFDFGKLK